MLVLAVPATFVFEAQFFEFFSQKPPRIDSSWLVPTLRVCMVSALALVAAVHIVFRRLLEMVATVRTGDPLVPEHAARLQTIAWCSLVIEVLRLLLGRCARTLH